MHDCPLCQAACDCDGEDHFNDAASNEREHDCEPNEDGELEDLEDLGLPGYEDDGQPSCRVCGCTQDRACAGGCVWATADLCSRCVAVAL